MAASLPRPMSLLTRLIAFSMCPLVNSEFLRESRITSSGRDRISSASSSAVTMTAPGMVSGAFGLSSANTWLGIVSTLQHSNSPRYIAGAFSIIRISKLLAQAYDDTETQGIYEQPAGHAQPPDGNVPALTLCHRGIMSQPDISACSSRK